MADTRAPPATVPSHAERPRTGDSASSGARLHPTHRGFAPRPAAEVTAESLDDLSWGEPVEDPPEAISWGELVEAPPPTVDFLEPAPPGDAGVATLLETRRAPKPQVRRSRRRYPSAVPAEESGFEPPPEPAAAIPATELAPIEPSPEPAVAAADEPVAEAAEAVSIEPEVAAAPIELTAEATPIEPTAEAVEGAPVESADEADGPVRSELHEAEADELNAAAVTEVEPASETKAAPPWWRGFYSGGPQDTHEAPLNAAAGEADEGSTRTHGLAAFVSSPSQRRAIALSVIVLVVIAVGFVGIAPLGRLFDTLPPRHAVPAKPDNLSPVPEEPPATAANRPPVPEDPAKRFAFYLARAKTGDTDAQLRVAILYAKGDGVPQDYRTAATWFRAAAEHGVPRAQYDLGVLYERGRGLSVDYNEAFIWYKRSAEGGYPLAEYNLAVAYTRGQGTPQDFAAAAEWYRRAAEQGVVPAMINLAILYERGDGVEASTIDAYAWYRAAASRGNEPSTKRASELFDVLSQQDRERAEARAAVVMASVPVLPSGEPAAAAPPGPAPTLKPGLEPAPPGQNDEKAGTD
jgi:hypothetical protein